MSKMMKNTEDALKAEVKELSQDKNLLETVVATGALGGGSGANSELQELILGRLKKRALEEEEQESAALERKKKRLLTEAHESEKKNRTIAWQQQNCSHLDGLGQKATGGQWNSDGRYVVWCLHCFKKFTNAPDGTPCPPNLVPDEMGGAVMEAVNRIGSQEYTPVV